MMMMLAPSSDPTGDPQSLSTAQVVVQQDARESSSNHDCTTCGFACETNEDLQLHCAYNHYFGLIYVCKFCSEEFDEKVAVAEHILQ